VQHRETPQPFVARPTPTLQADVGSKSDLSIRDDHGGPYADTDNAPGTRVMPSSTVYEMDDGPQEEGHIAGANSSIVLDLVKYSSASRADYVSSYHHGIAFP